jgi:hypothetical protein
MNSNDIVLEPSCGTGSLAVWARAAGAAVITNEIDPRRRGLSSVLGFDPTGHNAEFIDDLLPENVIPNIILANPPFSSNGGRTKRNQWKFGFRHVESALRRLDRDGRFGVILGESGSFRTGSGKMFWESLSPDIRVSASIELPGSEYYKNGTTVGITLLLGKKLGKGMENDPAAANNSLIISASSVEDAFEKALSAGLRFKPTS